MRFKQAVKDIMTVAKWRGHTLSAMVRDDEINMHFHCIRCKRIVKLYKRFGKWKITGEVMSTDCSLEDDIHYIIDSIIDEHFLWSEQIVVDELDLSVLTMVGIKNGREVALKQLGRYFKKVIK